MNYGVYNEFGELVVLGVLEDSQMGEFKELHPRVIFCTEPFSNRTHYVDLQTGELRRYTDKELETKATLLPGWRWKMPERCVEYTWTKEQAAEHAEMVCRQQRARSYPSLADFADAVYWQSKGDNSKMQAYLAACDKVKQDFPKPNVSQG